MRREDSILCTIIVMVMMTFMAAGVVVLGFAILVGGAGHSENVERVIPETTIEEPETTKQEEQTASETVVEVTEDTEQEATVPDAEQEAKLETKTETQELSPEEIWQQEADYFEGYLLGTTAYDSYRMMKTDYEYNIVLIPEYVYQQYLEATRNLLQDAMSNSEISDKTLEEYNAVVAKIPESEYMQISQDGIMNMQGFQEGVTYYSYMEAVKELRYSSGEMDEEQYQAWLEKMLYREDDITHETVMKRIEYSKQLLSQYGKENIPIPYFWGI